MHQIKVREVYYNKIKAREKIYEVRLNDEKRREIKVGDILEIKKEPNLDESLTAKVVELLHFKSFEEMANAICARQIGFEGCSVDHIVSVYHEFYTAENEKKYGVVAIKVEVL